MAVPEQFYTPTNEEITRDKIVQDWIDNYIKNNEGKLTDFSEGSEIRNILESFALSIYVLEYYKMLEFRQHWIIYASGSYLDLHGTALRMPRKQGSYATGYVTITLPRILDYDYYIDDGITFVNPNTNIQYLIYKTMEQKGDNYQYYIPAGSLSIEIPVISSLIGAVGNTGKKTVNAFYYQMSLENVTCINYEPISGGSDVESDDDYRARLLSRERESSFGGKVWYQNICRQVEGVHDVYVTFMADYVHVYINGNYKPINPTILATCLSELNKKHNHLLGHNFRVYEPDYYDLNLKIQINGGSNLTENNIISRMNALIDGGRDDNMYFLGYNLGQSPKESEIISALNSLEGVKSVTPYIANKDGEYDRFKKIPCQPNQVVRILDIIVEFRSDE